MQWPNIKEYKKENASTAEKRIDKDLVRSSCAGEEIYKFKKCSQTSIYNFYIANFIRSSSSDQKWRISYYIEVWL